MEELNITGIVENIIYHNEDNGYCVFSLTDEFNENVICVVYIPTLREGESLSIFGSFVTHNQYGEQFKVSKLEKVLPSSVKGIENYLASGNIKGIGKSLAKKIVTLFKEDTLLVIEQEFEKLTQIKGISLSKATSINQQYMEKNEERAVFLFLSEYNISPTYATKIYKKYKSRSIDIIKKNPYLLCEDIFGVGFKFADEIAQKSGIDKNSIFRIKAGVKYALNDFVARGNVYCLKDHLIFASSDILNLPKEEIENGILELQKDSVVSQVQMENDIAVYLSSYLYAENYIAKKLIELNKYVLDKQNYEDTIKEVQRENNIFLADTQYEAVLNTMQHGVLVITGGPGTGKTTTIKTIITLLEKMDNEVLLCAPTGRAAKRMTEATGKEAQTIHRLLGYSFGESGKNQSFEKNEENPIECDVLIVDESSMIDTMLMFHLLKAINHGTRVILVGDVDQLPSVSAGNVLKDIINSEIIPTIKLVEIFRQSKESDIVINAHKINLGKYPEIRKDSKDFFFVNREDINEVALSICDLVLNRLPKYMNCDSMRDIQVLTPMKKTPIGVWNLNNLLQEQLNPPSKNKKEKEFRGGTLRVGDKVMQIKNNYTIQSFIKDKKGSIIQNGTGVFNGDEGYVTNIDDFNEVVEVVFDDNKYVNYEFANLDELDLSYAITVHKSQGSEYPVIIIPVHSGPPMLLNRNLLYTGITRGKSLVVLVGIKETFYKMIDNDKEINRFSSLDKYIKDINKILG
ncbi:MAG: ATP-dependent RecD-like DNA helicase [Lachnospirales bacterium]